MALSYLHMAAMQNDVQAHLALATRYAHGLGVEANCRKSLFYYNLPAKVAS